jgi:hypothetical protein
MVNDLQQMLRYLDKKKTTDEGCLLVFIYLQLILSIDFRKVALKVSWTHGAAC